MKKPIVALLYDFDSTLSKSDMQNFGFIPALGMTPAEFWGETGRFGNESGMERTLSYLYTMVRLSKQKGIKMTKKWLAEMGKNIEFFPGVLDWFHRINEYGKSQEVIVEHYIISSGNKEIVDGCAIAKEFKKIYGCEFYFNEEGEAVWPKLAINFTQKTQYFFRIAKGVIDQTDDEGVNAKAPTKRIPYSNMIYVGDGMTDIPSMIIVKNNGGKSIAVYPPGKGEKVQSLVDDGRVNYSCVANYKEGSKMDKIVKLIIQGVSINQELDAMENKNPTSD